MITETAISEFRHHDSAQPKHVAVKAFLLERLADAEVNPGDALPTEQALAEALGLARNTVRQALGDLERDGVIVRLRGKGTFVKEKPTASRAGLNVFALVVPETGGGFYPELLGSFEHAASELQHQVMVCNSRNDLGRQADILMQLIDKQVAGVAIVPATQPETPAYQIRQLVERDIPVVFCHRRVEGASGPLLALPYYDVGRTAGRILVEHGHRRVGYVATLPSSSGLAYEHGLREAMELAGGELSARFVHYTNAFPQDGLEVEEELLPFLSSLLSEPRRPTALMTSFDSLGESVYLVANRLGIRIPEDLSLISFGGNQRTSALIRRLSAVTLDEAGVAMQAVKLLHEMRTGKRARDDTETIPLSLSVYLGATLAAPSLDPTTKE